jgi:hypothetical protein
LVKNPCGINALCSAHNHEQVTELFFVSVIINRLLLFTYFHFSASTSWETFTYLRLFMGLGSVRQRKFMWRAYCMAYM